MSLDKDLIQQFAEMGATFAPTALPPQPTEEAFEVQPANWKSVIAFLACETQWRAVAGMAGVIWLGLDYGATDVVLRRMQVGDEEFAAIQVMETEALEVFGEQQK